MKRFGILGLTVVLLVGVTVGGALAFTAGHALAAQRSMAAQQAPAIDLSAEGPSVGVDVSGNQMVFWHGSTNTKLYEAVYTADTSSWNSGAIDLGSVGANLASAPSVAVANFGGFLSQGHRYGAQFVVWRGASDDLWYADWNGSWYGAVEVPGVFNVAATPSVAFNNKENSWGPGESEITIFYEGTDGNPYFIRRTNPLGVSGSPGWVGPFELTSNGHHLGPLGSRPGASNTSRAEVTPSGIADGKGVVTWKGGTNSDMWLVPYTISYNSGDLTAGSLQKSPWTGINGGPSSTEEYPVKLGVFDFVWQDNNHDLEYNYADGGLSTYYSSGDVGGSGSLASAPSIGYWQPLVGGDFQLFVFFKGSDGYLHEAFDKERDFNGWHFYSFPQFGQVG